MMAHFQKTYVSATVTDMGRTLISKLAIAMWSDDIEFWVHAVIFLCGFKLWESNHNIKSENTVGQQLVSKNETSVKQSI